MAVVTLCCRRLTLCGAFRPALTRARTSARAEGEEVEVEQAVPATDEDIIEEDTDGPMNT